MAKPRKVRVRYVGPGAYFTGQGEKHPGDTVEVWDYELKARWDLKPITKPKPTTPAK